MKQGFPLARHVPESPSSCQRSAMAAAGFQNHYKDLDAHIAQLLQCKPRPEAKIKAIREKAKQILAEESNVTPARAPVTVYECFGPLQVGCGVQQAAVQTCLGIRCNLCVLLAGCWGAS